MGSRSPNSNHDFFLVQVCFGKCFGASSQSNQWAGHCRLLYKIQFFITHHNLIEKWFAVVAQNKPRRHFKPTVFKFSVSSWGIHLLSFFTFTICFECQMTIEWLTMSSLALSHVVVRGSTSMIALSWSLSTYDGQLLGSSFSRLSSPLQNFLNHHCTVCSLAVPGPNVLLMLWVVSSALRPILNTNKKTRQICFLSNIISIV